MRPYLLAGNWKMNKDINEAVELARAVAEVEIPDGREVMIAPSFVCLSEVSKVLAGSGVQLGCQNFYPEDSGAFTGEISAGMLKSAGVSYIIIGHSERRAIFHESEELINRKVIKALDEGFKAVLCVGETLEEREGGKASRVVEDQVRKGLNGVSETAMKNVVIAYEPVWAIGTGKTASPQDADDMHAHIRSVVKDLYSDTVKDEMRILYGGSVKDSNVDELMAMENLDGGLVGGAALKADSFKRIIRFEK